MLTYKRAQIEEDLAILTETRITVLRAANKLVFYSKSSLLKIGFLTVFTISGITIINHTMGSATMMPQ